PPKKLQRTRNWTTRNRTTFKRTTRNRSLTAATSKKNFRPEPSRPAIDRDNAKAVAPKQKLRRGSTCKTRDGKRPISGSQKPGFFHIPNGKESARSGAGRDKTGFWNRNVTSVGALPYQCARPTFHINSCHVCNPC